MAWATTLEGLNDIRSALAMMRTPDGHGRIEPAKFHTPPAVRSEPESAPANALGRRRIMFAVNDGDDVVARLRRHGGELVGEIAQYEDVYRLCFVRGPEGIIIGLAEQPSKGAAAGRPRGHDVAVCAFAIGGSSNHRRGRNEAVRILRPMPRRRPQLAHSSSG